MDKAKEDKKKLITYGMYCNFIKEIKHFDNLQTYFRILSSTILLGSIAALGFLFSIENFQITLQRIFSSFIILLIGISTLFSLWHIDLKFYERLLVSNFAEAFRLENENDWLPKVHHNMLFGVSKKDHPSNVAYYYSGCILTLTLTGGLMISCDFYFHHNFLVFAIATLILTAIVMIIFHVIIKKRTKKISDLMKEINYIEE